MTASLGGPAPEFTLRDQHGVSVSLTDLTTRGPVVVVFYPFAFSGVCTGELCEVRDRREELLSAGGDVVAISCDPMFALRVLADRDGLEFPLLSDFWPHGSVAQAYGVFDTELGCPTRSSFVVGTDGRLHWMVHNAMGEARRFDDYLREVAALG